MSDRRELKGADLPYNGMGDPFSKIAIIASTQPTDTVRPRTGLSTHGDGGGLGKTTQVAGDIVGQLSFLDELSNL